MIDELVAKAQAAGYVLDAETVAVLREMEILLEIGKLAKSDPNKEYTVEEADALYPDAVDADELLANFDQYWETNDDALETKSSAQSNPNSEA